MNGRGPAAVAERGRRVLIADDNRVIRELLQRIIAQAGYEVNAVADGAQALQAMTVSAYDVVLMDVSMPVMNGIDATRALRALALPTDRPPFHIIGLSAHGSALNRRELLDAGMDQHLTKPVHLFSLLRALSVATARTFLREQP